MLRLHLKNLFKYLKIYVPMKRVYCSYFSLIILNKVIVSEEAGFLKKVKW